MNEVWKEIKDYEGLYAISNLGRLKQLSKKSGFLVLKERIMKTHIKENGYVYTTLYNQGIRTKKHIHRLVAEAFLPNPNNYPCINHKDGDRQNNKVSNLEWCSYSYNNAYSNCQEAAGLSRKIPVIQYDLNGNFIKKWESATQAFHELGIPNTAITACCKGRARTAKGFKWSYS